MKRFFSSKSAVDKGTLFQLKNLLNRTAVPADPGDNMKASDDFLLVVLHGYVIAAAKTLLSGETAKDVSSLAKNIVDSYVRIDIPSPTARQAHSDDGVYSYSTELLTLGLLWLNYYDSVREGDSNRII